MLFPPSWQQLNSPWKQLSRNRMYVNIIEVKGMGETALCWLKYFKRNFLFLLVGVKIAFLKLIPTLLALNSLQIGKLSLQEMVWALQSFISTAFTDSVILNSAQIAFTVQGTTDRLILQWTQSKKIYYKIVAWAQSNLKRFFF